MNIIEIEGDHEFIVVVPTKNIQSERAQNFISEIKSKSYFNPPIIMVESSGPEFHFSKNMNKGIKQAMKYNPKYIALSNDDVYPLEKGADYILIRRIIKYGLAYISPIFVDRAGRKKVPVIGMPNYYAILSLTTFYPLIPHFAFPLLQKINTFFVSNKNMRNRDDNLYGIINTQPFSIFDANILNHIGGFDEDFKNGCEDLELSMRIQSFGYKAGLDYSVEFLDIGSATIGEGGFSILYRKQKAKKEQVNNWRTLIRKYKKKYQKYASSNHVEIFLKP